MTSAREPFAPPPPLPHSARGIFSSLAKGRVAPPAFYLKQGDFLPKHGNYLAESPRSAWKIWQKVVPLHICCKLYPNGISV